MEYVFPAAFLAGLLTVLAPCTLTLLPVILGGSVGGNKWRPLIVSLSLGVSVIIFTLLIKMSGAFLDFDGDGIADIPDNVMRWISGGIILFLGLTMVFPHLWEVISLKLGLYKSNELLEKSNEKGGVWGSILLGASLGPVFNSCSPTYLLILATILPSSFRDGFLTLLAYTFGLVLFLLILGYGGRKLTSKFRSAANPAGWLKKGIGVLLVMVGVLVVFSLDKKLEAWIISTGFDLGVGEVFNVECLVIDCDQRQEIFYPE